MSGEQHPAVGGRPFGRRIVWGASTSNDQIEAAVPEQRRVLKAFAQWCRQLNEEEPALAAVAA